MLLFCCRSPAVEELQWHYDFMCLISTEHLITAHQSRYSLVFLTWAEQFVIDVHVNTLMGLHHNISYAQPH
ncbi:hypothetical protein FR483_n397L [Paramecium bursaria Chlorella virus FR483]|uniref:Uncharacterized protein n397L n=1 Tax=Paramecium bursaria Chlorella virus FR483 TaxID=399781 RepID=A7J7A1_PBCVF|nr:hypothetical protein FR483_n397L [Paramecium bursaria Chlorella virus FR483]ABT15682.1 hypothetical protein FR483_n397L [Paramecium bursaria Chlorella virus FR483]